MSAEKLRQWLKLRNGPWPPNYYALIGLRDGEGSPEEIEARILERLELLRRYQLPHPDEATEGMNLLARALDCLTNPDARRDYDRSLGLVRTNEPALPPEPVDELLNSLFAHPQLLPIPETPAESILPASILLPDLEEEVEPDDEPVFEEMPEAILVELVEPPPLPLKPVEEVPEAILLPEAKRLPDPPPLPRRTRLREGPVRVKSTRPPSRARELYADLARIRKVLRLWDRARPYISDLDRTFNRRTDSIALLGWLAELRPLLPTITDHIGGPDQPGSIIAAIARQRLVSDMFRSLLPSQREALAKDFRAAHYRLAQEYDELRDRVRRRTEKDFIRSVWNPMMKHFADYPEWFLLVLSVLVLLAAVLRSV